jgi:hypothetical protein
MEKMDEKISEIITLVNNKDFTYKSKSSELIQTLKEIEKKKETSETQLTAILLNFLIGNYNLYGFNFNLISKETKDAIEKLMKALYDSVLPNAYSLFDSIKTGKEKINPLLLEACKKTYKQKQIDFIRKFYNKILYKNLKDYFPINDIDKIIADEGWTKDKDYIVPNEKNASPEFNVAKEIEDIKYINDMNVQFNKLIKEHEHLVTFLNSKPGAK